MAGAAAVLIVVFVFLGAAAAADALSFASGEAFEETVVVLEGAALCFVCVVVVGFVVVDAELLAGGVVSEVFFFTHDG